MSSSRRFMTYSKIIGFEIHRTALFCNMGSSILGVQDIQTSVNVRRHCFNTIVTAPYLGRKPMFGITAIRLGYAAILDTCTVSSISGYGTVRSLSGTSYVASCSSLPRLDLFERSWFLEFKATDKAWLSDFEHSQGLGRGFRRSGLRAYQKGLKFRACLWNLPISGWLEDEG